MSTWNQQAVADVLGVSKPSVRRWLVGERYPEPRYIKLIAMTFNWPIEHQISAIPEDYADKNEVYGMAFHEALNDWWSRQRPADGTPPTRRRLTRVSLILAYSADDLADVEEGTRIATNTNEIYEKDSFHGETYWITPGQLNRTTHLAKHLFPAVVLPRRV